MSRFESRGRGSKVEVEGQKSRVENTKFLSILKVLQPLNAAKQLVLLSKLKNFAYAGLCCMAMYCITESFACGTKSLMRGLMFESIHLFILHWSLTYTNTDDYTNVAFHSHEKFDYR
jgi:hypothetical protein